jgi:predicted Zn-dependent peptidase
MKTFSNYYFPKIQAYQLSNGLTIAWNPRQEINSFYLEAFIQTGSAQEPSNCAGLAHFLEHLLLFSPTQSFPTAESISRFTARIGGWIDGEIDYHRIKIEANFPLENLIEGVQLVKEIIFFSKFRPEIIATERQRIIQEIKSREDNPSVKILDLLYEQRAKEKESAFRNSVGTESSINKITPDELWKFYQKIIHPSNVLLVMSGPFSLKQDIETKIIPSLETIEAKNQPVLPYRKTTFTSSQRKHYPQPNLQEIYFGCSFPMTPFSFAEELKLDLLHYLLNYTATSMLSKVRENGLAYDISTGHFALSKKAFFYFVGHTENTSKVEEIFHYFKKNLLENPLFLTPVLFQQAKEQYLHFSLVDFESPAIFSHLVGEHYIKNKEIFDPQLKIREINRISFDQVKTLITKLFSQQHMDILTMGETKK